MNPSTPYQVPLPSLWLTLYSKLYSRRQRRRSSTWTEGKSMASRSCRPPGPSHPPGDWALPGECCHRPPRGAGWGGAGRVPLGAGPLKAGDPAPPAAPATGAAPAPAPSKGRWKSTQDWFKGGRRWDAVTALPGHGGSAPRVIGNLNEATQSYGENREISCFEEAKEWRWTN